MKWTEEKLKRLKEINSEKKIPRYFSIKKFVDEMVNEKPDRPTFKNDKTKDGWELIEDIGFIPALTSPKSLELVNFLKGDESYVNDEMMIERARGELKANLGQQHAEYLLEHQNEIPKKFRKYYLIFTGTVWRDPDGDRSVACLHWDGDEWSLNFYWLDYDWYGHNRLPRLRE